MTHAHLQQYADQLVWQLLLVLLHILQVGPVKIRRCHYVDVCTDTSPAGCAASAPYL